MQPIKEPTAISTQCEQYENSIHLTLEFRDEADAGRAFDLLEAWLVRGGPFVLTAPVPAYVEKGGLPQ